MMGMNSGSLFLVCTIEHDTQLICCLSLTFNIGLGLGVIVKAALDALDSDEQQMQTNEGVPDSPYETESDAIVIENRENGTPTGSEGKSGSNNSRTVRSSAYNNNAFASSGSQGKHGAGSSGPPPYRTATLVFKLLQIGSYCFRSFSDVNPNRLRVLFNTQYVPCIHT